MSREVSMLVAIMYLYINDYLDGRVFVSKIDQLVAESRLMNLPSDCQNSFDELHELLALCVWSESTYKENPNIYTNEFEIKKHVENFLSNWGEVFAEKIGENQGVSQLDSTGLKDSDD